MGKNRATRFNDTVTFIRNYAACGLPGPIRHDIGTYVAAQFPRLTPAQQTAYDALSDEMSVKTSIPVKANRGTEAQREERRALVLLWRAMGATQANPPALDGRVAEAMSLAPGAIGAVLTETMIKAAVVASGAGASHVFNMELSANPLGFITTRRIFIGGSTTGADKLQDPAAASYENNLDFRFQYHAEKDYFQFARQALAQYGASHTIPSVSVPALHWSDVPGRGLVPVPAAPAAPVAGVVPPPPPSFAGMLGIRFTGGPVWMFTTQFTGCSFCYKIGGGAFYAAHISPAGIAGKPVLSGQALANQIMGGVANVGGGDFANTPAGGAALNVFGNGAGNVVPFGGGNAFYPPKVQGASLPGEMKWMSLFGRFTGAWELYTQSVDGSDAIMEARRIL